MIKINLLCGGWIRLGFCLSPQQTYGKGAAIHLKWCVQEKHLEALLWEDDVDSFEELRSFSSYGWLEGFRLWSLCSTPDLNQ